MKKYKLIASCLGAWLFAMVPLASHAFTVTSTVTSSDATDVVTDVSDMVPSAGPADIIEKVTAFNYTAETGTATYTATFTVTDDANELDAAPFIMAAGANITDFSLDSATEPYQYTATFTTGDFYIPDMGISQQFVFVFIGTVPNPSLDNPVPGNGPPAAMSGGYIATTVQDFQIIPPTGPEDAAFGVILNGPADTSGFFKMKFPASMLELMSTMSGKTIDATNLAVFVDDDQASMSVTPTDDGGVLIDIQVTFSDGSTDTASVTADSSTVSKQIVAKEQLDLSLALINATVARNEKATLYGWRESNYANKTVKIYRKKSGSSKFTLIDTVTTDNAGYYEYSFKAKKLSLKAGTYIFKAVSGGVSSPKQSLVITK
ncbi:MAG: hypothetical protein ACD_43C00143G0004 [uncultured bacterium]|nr:MAG: hypothetical protein ACD_43C00143G0004 [uncultured bacterium]